MPPAAEDVGSLLPGAIVHDNRMLAERAFYCLFVRAKPCLPLCSFSLIRKTELWETNKPPAMQVS